VRSRGTTLLETCVALFVITIISGAILAVINEMTYFLGDQNTRAVFALDSSMALTKLESELREIGQTTVAGTSYPYLGNGNTQLNFVRLADPPCRYDGGTDLEWDPTVYTVKAVNGELAVWQGATKKLVLCTSVQAVTFGLSGRRITVDLVLQRTDQRGQELSEASRRIIGMRN
jgi:hypothetical protein